MTLNSKKRRQIDGVFLYPAVYMLKNSSVKRTHQDAFWDILQSEYICVDKETYLEQNAWNETISNLI